MIVRRERVRMQQQKNGWALGMQASGAVSKGRLMKRAQGGVQAKTRQEGLGRVLLALLGKSMPGGLHPSTTIHVMPLG